MVQGGGSLKSAHRMVSPNRGGTNRAIAGALAGNSLNILNVQSDQRKTRSMSRGRPQSAAIQIDK